MIEHMRQIMGMYIVSDTDITKNVERAMKK
jgi:hypothetical protein